VPGHGLDTGEDSSWAGREWNWEPRARPLVSTLTGLFEALISCQASGERLLPHDNRGGQGYRQNPVLKARHCAVGGDVCRLLAKRPLSQHSQN
jgi:hypothetical protein